MSNDQSNPHGILTPASFILSCLHAVFKEQLIHDRWLPAEQLRTYIHMKCNIADDIQFSHAAMMRVINKKMPPPVAGMEPNTMEGAGGVKLNVFRHSFQVKKRCHLFWITAKVGASTPILPSQGNA